MDLCSDRPQLGLSKLHCRQESVPKKLDRKVIGRTENICRWISVFRGILYKRRHRSVLSVSIGLFNVRTNTNHMPTEVKSYFFGVRSSGPELGG